ncbi:MAG: Uma2 family endonuclease [Cyanobacteria bacterium J06642_2]
MVASPQPQVIKPEEYLVWETQQDLRYEYDSGETWAMTGGTLPHNDLAINLLVALLPHVRKRGCRINMADAKVQVSDDGPYFYSDLVVSCDRRDCEATKLIRYPTLVVEVLSSGTESRDRGRKFRQFQRSVTLQEYVLVDYESERVECFRRSQETIFGFTKPLRPEMSYVWKVTNVNAPLLQFMKMSHYSQRAKPRRRKCHERDCAEAKTQSPAPQ